MIDKTELLKEAAHRETGGCYKYIENNIKRQKRLIDSMLQKKQKLEESIEEQSEKLSEILLDAVDKGEIHIVDAYAYWGNNNEHLPIDSCIDNEFLGGSGCERRRTILYFDRLPIPADTVPPPIKESKWKQYLEDSYDLDNFSWAVSEDDSLYHEGIFDMLRTIIANGQKGFVCDW